MKQGGGSTIQFAVFTDKLSSQQWSRLKVAADQPADMAEKAAELGDDVPKEVATEYTDTLHVLHSRSWNWKGVRANSSAPHIAGFVMP